VPSHPTVLLTVFFFYKSIENLQTANQIHQHPTLFEKPKNTFLRRRQRDDPSDLDESSTLWCEAAS
jgi:hypothetical protein